MEIFWIFFTLIPLATFAVMETIGLFSKKPYTRYLRKWLGTDPPRKGVRWSWYSFIGIWVLFVIWFPIHLLCAWPWETSC